MIYAATCSYAELFLFKKLAAIANMDFTGLQSEADSLIQGMNDKRICSYNEKLSSYGPVHDQLR